MHGLEAAQDDVDGPTAYLSWGCVGTFIGGTSTAISTGEANTRAINAGCSELGIPGRMAMEYEQNGFEDWYLPSRDELDLMNQNQGLIGGFANCLYWSSSEDSSSSAWYQEFNNGGYNRQFIWPKIGHDAGNCVRAIRSF